MDDARTLAALAGSVELTSVTSWVRLPSGFALNLAMVAIVSPVKRTNTETFLTVATFGGAMQSIYDDDALALDAYMADMAEHLAVPAVPR